MLCPVQTASPSKATTIRCGIVKFAIDNTSTILMIERKRLV